MKNKLNIFEKISLTFGVINAILFVVGMFVGYIWENEVIVMYCTLPIAIQVGVTILLIILFEIILCKIWGLEVHIFPSLF
jgi:hypothetical protein